MEGFQQGGGRMGEKVQRISNLNCRFKIDKGKLRILLEMEKPRNL